MFPRASLRILPTTCVQPGYIQCDIALPRASRRLLPPPSSSHPHLPLPARRSLLPPRLHASRSFFSPPRPPPSWPLLLIRSLVSTRLTPHRPHPSPPPRGLDSPNDLIVSTRLTPHSP